MNIEKMREEFEFACAAHIQEKLGGPIPKGVLDEYMVRGSDGEYRSYQALGAWWGWQASRESLVIELPAYEVDVDPDDDYEAMEQQEALSMLEHHVIGKFRKSIEAAGLKVKS